MEKVERVMDKELYEAAVSGDKSVLYQAHHEEYFLSQADLKYNYLHIAILKKQYEFIEVALKSFPGQNDGIYKVLSQQNWEGDTPLHVAARVGDPDILNLLLEFTGVGEHDRGKLWRMPNDKGDTPLHHAIGNFKATEALLAVLDPQVTRDINLLMETPLHLALAYCSLGTHFLSIVELLLQKDSSISCWRDFRGLTPLLKAASLTPPYGIETVKLILRYHPQSADVCDLSGKTILHHLTRKLSYLEARELLGFPEIKSLVNYIDDDGNTPAHVAVINHDFNIVRVLMDCSEDFLVSNNEGISAATSLAQKKRILESATYELMEEEQEALAPRKMEFTIRGTLGGEERVFLLWRTPTGQNILHLFMERYNAIQRTDEVNFILKEILEEYPYLLWGTDVHGNTPLHSFAEGVINDGNIRAFGVINAVVEICDECIKSRDEWESPWRMKNEDGNTPLHLAASVNLKVAVEIWKIDKQVVCYTNARLETPLHLISQCGKFSLSRALMLSLISLLNCALPNALDI